MASMTWSIIARDGTGRLGVAVASKFFAVGAPCAHTLRGVGAVATQALMNPLYGPQGLDLLASGHPADDALACLLAADAGRDQRQVHLLPAPSWGSMLNVAKNYVDNAPWMAIWPGLSIFLLVLSFNLLGDGLRDALDPRQR